MLEPQRENIGSISQIELYIAPMARLAVIQLGAADLHAKRQVVQHGWPHLGQFFPGSTQLSIPRPAQLGHLTPGIYQNMNFSNSGITRWFPMGTIRRHTPIKGVHTGWDLGMLSPRMFRDGTSWLDPEKKEGFSPW